MLHTVYRYQRRWLKKGVLPCTFACVWRPITRAFPFTTPANASTLVARWRGLKMALEVVKKCSAVAKACWP